jgi:hypothetical protein
MILENKTWIWTQVGWVMGIDYENIDILHWNVLCI